MIKERSNGLVEVHELANPYHHKVFNERLSKRLDVLRKYLKTTVLTYAADLDKAEEFAAAPSDTANLYR